MTIFGQYVTQREKTSQTVQKRFYHKEHLKKRKLKSPEDLNQFYWNFVTLFMGASANFLCGQFIFHVPKRQLNHLVKTFDHVYLDW